MGCGCGAVRADLLGLTDEMLADLTTVGTVRRSRRELDGAKVGCTVVESADGSVVVEADDGTRCELSAAGSFDTWLCTCLAATRCRHLVRAVMAYREWTVADGSASAEPDTEGLPEPAAERAVEPVASESFWPGEVADEALRRALSPQVWRSAEAAADRGLLAQVSRGAIAVVRLHHPVSVTVRFLLGADLGYARCDCDAAAPCLHVALAVWAARGRPALDSSAGLFVTGEDWRAGDELLGQVEACLRDLVSVGVDAAHRVLGTPLDRLARQCEAAGLHALAGVLGEVGEELGRYAASDARFTGEGLVELLGEAFARLRSLRSRRPGRVPDRLVAGTAATGSTRLRSARLMGMGTEVIEREGRPLVRAVLVDARTGTACGLTRTRTEDPAKPSSGHRLAQVRIAGVPLAEWGAGQVLLTRGSRDGNGELSVGRQASVLPGSDFSALGPPHVAGSLDDLGRLQTRLPRVLDARSVATGLAAVRATVPGAPRFDPVAQQLQAGLLDARGAPLTLAAAWTSRSSAGLDALATLLGRAAETKEPVWVSGRWRWSAGTGAVVDPLLVTCGAQAVQPRVSLGSPGEGGLPVQTLETLPARSEAAILADVTRHLGGVLVSGLGRARVDDSPELADLARRCRDSGATRIAGLVDQLHGPDPADSAIEALVTLLLVACVGAPIVAG